MTERIIEAADFSTMNYGELETFESIAGVIPTNEKELGAVPRSKLMIALGFIAERRSNPDVTLEEIRSLPMGSIQFAGDDEDDDPSL